MNQKKAIRLAVEVLRKEIQRLAVDANLHDQYGLDSVHAVNASKKRKELLEAVQVCQRILEAD